MHWFKTLCLGALCSTVVAAQPPPSIYETAAAEIQRGDASKAIALLEARLRESPRDLKALTLMGMALSAANRREEANGYFRRALQFDPKFVPALKNLAINEAAQGQTALAKQHFEQVLQLTPSDARAHFAAGTLLAGMNDYAAAAREFALARSQGYDPPYDAGFNLLLAYVRAKQYPDALKTGEELIAQGHRKAELYNLLAQAYEGAGKTGEAYEALRTAIQIEPADPSNYLDLIALCLIHNNHDLALEIANVSVSRLPQSDRLHLQRGIALAMKEDFEGAKSEFEHSVKLAPDNSLGYVALGLILMQMDEPSEAVTLLRQRAQAGGGDYLVLWFLGEALNRSGATIGSPEEREAVEALSRSVRLNGNVPQSRILLAKLLAQRGDVDAAMRQLEQALALDPENVSATYQLARLCQKKGDAARAKQLFAKVGQAKEDDREQFTRGGLQHIIRAGQSDVVERATSESAEAAYQRGLAYDRSGRTDEAIAAFEEALRLRPDFIEARYLLAGCCRKRGDFEGEMRLLADVVEHAPNHAEAHYNYGLALQREQKLEQAIEQLRVAVQLSPDNTRYALALGIALADRNQDEAIRAFRRAAELAPSDPETHYNLALALAAAGNGPDAVREFEAAIRLKPDHAAARRGLGITLMHQEQLEEAAAQLRKALEIAPGDAEAANNLGLVQLRLKQFDPAVTSFERAIELNPRLIKAHFNLAQAYARAGRREDAKRESDRAAALTAEQRSLGRAMVLVQVARQRLASGDGAGALSALREAVAVSPDFIDAHWQLGQAIMETGGDPAEALREFRRVLHLNPERAEAHYEIGQVLLKMGQQGGALDEFRAAAQMAPCRIEMMRALESISGTGGMAKPFLPSLPATPERDPR